MSTWLRLPDDLTTRGADEAAKRDMPAEDLAAETLAERFQPRKHGLSIAGMGASTSGRHAIEDEEMLADGFGRDSLRSDAPEGYRRFLADSDSSDAVGSSGGASDSYAPAGRGSQ